LNYFLYIFFTFFLLFFQAVSGDLKKDLSICDLCPQLGHKLVASILSGQGHNYVGCITDPGDSFKGITNILVSHVDEKQMRGILKKDITIISLETEETTTSQKSKYASFSFSFSFSLIFFSFLFLFFNFIIKKKETS
jgi:hypothetical protein